MVLLRFICLFINVNNVRLQVILIGGSLVAMASMKPIVMLSRFICIYFHKCKLFSIFFLFHNVRPCLQVILMGGSAGAIGTEANCDAFAARLQEINPGLISFK